MAVALFPTQPNCGWFAKHWISTCALILSPYLIPSPPFPVILTLLITILLVTQRNHLCFLYVHPLSCESIISPWLCLGHSLVFALALLLTATCLDATSLQLSSPLFSSPPIPQAVSLSALSGLCFPKASFLLFVLCSPVPTPSTLSHLFVSFKGRGHVYAFCPPQSPQWRASASCWITPLQLSHC